MNINFSNSFDEMTDEEIIQLLHDGKDGAIDFLMERYKNLVRKKARTLYLIGGDNDDLIQEGMIGLYKAARNYEPKKGVSFYHFAELCITRQLYNAVKASRRMKNTPLNSYVSLYAPMNREVPDEDSTATLADTLPPKEASNPEAIFLDKEASRLFEARIQSRLSSLENKVLELYLEGMDYQQIASALKKTPKSIDNALQRIRSKLRDGNFL